MRRRVWGCPEGKDCIIHDEDDDEDDEEDDEDDDNAADIGDDPADGMTPSLSSSRAAL